MKKFLFTTLFLSIIVGCSIIGIHFHIHNPRRAGKYPKKTEARVLLGNQDTKYRTCYDVKYYSLNVTFGNDLEKDHSIKGSVSINASALNDFDTLQLDLAENMVVDSIGEIIVHAKDERLKTFRNHSALFVIMNKKVSSGKNFSIVVRYHGTPSVAKRPPWSGGMVWKKDNLGKPFDGVACETEGASLWWPCKDVMNDEPDSVDIMLSVPEGVKAISNGKLKSEITLPGFDPLNNNKRTEFFWHVSYPINIYNITFYIGNYKLLHDTYYSEVTHDTLQLNHYVLEQNYDKAVEHFKQLKNYLAFYEKTFGPYPWYRDGFKLVESPYAGMEHQSAIAYGNGYKNDPRYGWDYIILHETAHEWWGNSVTSNDLADGWLHEGFATYAEALYMESIKGHQAYIDYLLYYRLFIINRRPVVGEHGIRYFDYHDGDIYMKGAWVLHSLRYAIGNDSLFFDILHSYYMENRYSTISSDKLEEIVNRKTGKDFHWFFQTYLYNRFTPELEYCVHDGKLFYCWTHVSKNFVMPVKVTTIGNSRDNFTIVPTGNSLTYQDEKENISSIKFNDSDFLFKPVENKNLWKRVEKLPK